MGAEGVRAEGHRIARPPWTRPAGLRMLAPGWAHWYWHQPRRAAILCGSYCAAIAVGLFAWGTALGWALLAFAWGTHVWAVADAIRQGAFPGFGRMVPLVAAVGVGLLGYGPALGFGLCSPGRPIAPARQANATW